jgi:hypothetical protein
LIKNLDAAIQNIDKKIQKKKMWGKFRTWMAVGASAGTIIVGRSAGQYIGEKFGEAAEYIHEKFQGSPKLASGAEAYLSGMEKADLDNLPSLDDSNHQASGAGSYLEGIDEKSLDHSSSDADQISKVELPSASTVENAEQFDKLVNKPFEDLKNMDINSAQSEPPAGMEMNHPDNNLPDANQPVTANEPVPTDDIRSDQEIIEQPPSNAQVPTEEEIPKIDEKTDKRVFVREGKIEEMDDYNPETSPHKFDKIDEVRSDNRVKDLVQENQVPPVVKEEVPQPTPEAIPENKIPDQIPEPAPRVEVSQQMAEQVEKITSGIDRIIGASDDPNQMMVFLRQEFCSNDIQNWRGICLNSVDSLIAEKSPGSVGEKIAATIEKLRADYGLGESVKPLYGETVEAWTRRASEIIMESKK